MVRGGFVEVGTCETVDEAESDCDSEDDDDSFADIDEQYILSNHVSAWYNIPSSACVCVSALFKQALIFQWLNFGQFTLFKQHFMFYCCVYRKS